ncbi:MAG: ubiquinol-cytochrome c reductase iron-sulfur subunit [Thermoanaerobaculia bacterium]|nr:ubiquinol-cytochrome c reductase iron-sulfur subunit [Thermoanaerobaculia bacterium]
MSPTDLKRRRFINWFLGTSAGALCAAVLFPVFRFLSPPRVPEATTNQVEAGPANEPIFLADGFKIVRFGADPVIVVRVAEGEFRAFAATCTHLDCIVTYQQDRSRIFCNCHNGVFNLNGQNVGGPPPKPLEQFEVNLVPQGEGQAPLVVVSRS